MGSPEQKEKPCQSANFRGATTAVVSVEDSIHARALEAVAGNFDLSLKCEDGVVVRAHRAVISPNFSCIPEALIDTWIGLVASDEVVCVVGDSRTWELIKHRLYEPYLRYLRRLAPDASSSSKMQLLKHVSSDLHMYLNAMHRASHCAMHCLPRGGSFHEPNEPRAMIQPGPAKHLPQSSDLQIYGPRSAPTMMYFCVVVQVAAQDLLHVAIGNDATSSNPIVQDLRGFFQARTLDSCDPSRDCPGSILTWLQFADTHNLHICSTSTGSASTEAAAWNMVERSLLDLYRAEDKAAVLMVLTCLQDLQPDFVEAVLVLLADTLLPDVAPVFSGDSLAHVSRPADGLSRVEGCVCSV